jgi:hypothetical protein
MQYKFNYLFFIICVPTLLSCTNTTSRTNTTEFDPFLGEWTSYAKGLTISKMDTAYQIEYFEKSGKKIAGYHAKIIRDDLLSYRDNDGIGRQIKIYIPNDDKRAIDKKGDPIFDLSDSLTIHLIITGDDDYYKKFYAANTFGLRGFAGNWVMQKKNIFDIYATLRIDSTDKGIEINWKNQPDFTESRIASFESDLLYVGTFDTDSPLYASYFRDCDCITMDGNRYSRYDENDDKFIGHWKSEYGEIKISKNGPYYLVRTHEKGDYIIDDLIEVKGNTLQESFEYVSPGIISWRDHEYTRVKN